MQTSRSSTHSPYAADPDRGEGAEGRHTGSTGLLIVAAIAFVVGLMVGAPSSGAGTSRIDWPKPAAAHPRSIGT